MNIKDTETGRELQADTVSTAVAIPEQQDESGAGTPEYNALLEEIRANAAEDISNVLSLSYYDIAFHRKDAEEGLSLGEEVLEYGHDDLSRGHRVLGNLGFIWSEALIQTARMDNSIARMSHERAVALEFAKIALRQQTSIEPVFEIWDLVSQTYTAMERENTMFMDYIRREQRIGEAVRIETGRAYGEPRPVPPVFH